MENQKYKYSVQFESDRMNILDASIRFACVLKSMASYSPYFSKAFLVNDKHEVAVNVEAMGANDCAILIANGIIQLRGHEYKRDNGLSSITMEFSQDLGFTFLVEYRNHPEKYCFNVTIGSKNGGGMFTFYKSAEAKGFVFTKELLNTIVQSTPTKYAAVLLDGREYARACKKFVTEIGWITYFPNEYPVAIPDDLPGIEYEHTATGKYLILTREDFTTDPLKLEAGKQRLIATMEEIARRVPAYRRD